MVLTPTNTNIPSRKKKSKMKERILWILESNRGPYASLTRSFPLGHPALGCEVLNFELTNLITYRKFTN